MPRGNVTSWQVTDGAAGGGALRDRAGHLVPGGGDVPERRRHRRGEQAQERALPRAARPEEADDAAPQRQGRVQGGGGAVGLGDVGEDGDRGVHRWGDGAVALQGEGGGGGQDGARVSRVTTAVSQVRPTTTAVVRVPHRVRSTSATRARAPNPTRHHERLELGVLR